MQTEPGAAVKPDDSAFMAGFEALTAFLATLEWALGIAALAVGVLVAARRGLIRHPATDAGAGGIAAVSTRAAAIARGFARGRGENV